MLLRDAKTIHVFLHAGSVSTDSVILLVSAITLVRIYLFTSSLLRYRGKEATKCLTLSRIAMFLQDSFGKHCRTEDLEDDYAEQKTKKKPIYSHWIYQVNL